jgi:hypothetical protein
MDVRDGRQSWVGVDGRIDICVDMRPTAVFATEFSEQP